MKKKIMFALIFLLVISLAANVFLLVYAKNSKNTQFAESAATGFATKTNENALVGQDLVEISQNELSKCCSFINKDGKEDGCYILSGYDCSYCNSYCS